jgi:hypothetical protein
MTGTADRIGTDETSPLSGICRLSLARPRVGRLYSLNDASFAHLPRNDVSESAEVAFDAPKAVGRISAGGTVDQSASSSGLLFLEYPASRRSLTNVSPSSGGSDCGLPASGTAATDLGRVLHPLPGFRFRQPSASGGCGDLIQRAAVLSADTREGSGLYSSSIDDR